MFEKRQYLQQYQTTLEVSYMEIYKDEVYDLLVTRENVRASHSFVITIHRNKEQAPKLPVRENDSGMVFVANLSRIPISSVDEFDHIYK
jgi:kinesin family protein 22